MVFTDSCLAVSIKEQVFTTMMSASSARGVMAAPEAVSSPIITSLSTRFLGHPRLTKPTLVGGADTGSWVLDTPRTNSEEAGSIGIFTCMHCIDLNTVIGSLLLHAGCTKQSTTLMRCGCAP